MSYKKNQKISKKANQKVISNVSYLLLVLSIKKKIKNIHELQLFKRFSGIVKPGYKKNKKRELKSNQQSIIFAFSFEHKKKEKFAQFEKTDRPINLKLLKQDLIILENEYDKIHDPKDFDWSQVPRI